MDAKTFYKNLKQRDRRALREIVQVLKEYHPIDVFAIDKAAERHHHKKYKTIDLLLKSVHTTSYNLSIGEIEGMGAKIDENKAKTIEDKSEYDSYVTDKMVEINYHRTKIRLFYTINDIGVSPKISL
ncbi:MAG: hypothetical protein KKA61_03085 [Nanoarchaeota archaeon]|nr:hypothetical protein [Nanoarchaeota archaeon]MBU4493330.1 hypothetical protein [Nanoarchaeota archaeon]